MTHVEQFAGGDLAAGACAVLPSPETLLHAMGAGAAVPDEIIQGVLRHADPDVLAAAFAQAAREVGEEDYRVHVTPGARGTDELGQLPRKSLASIAAGLLSEVAQDAGRSTAELPGIVPGLKSAAPSQMTSGDVAALADWGREKHPEAFGRAVARLASEDDHAAERLVGQRMMLLAIVALANRYAHRNH